MTKNFIFLCLACIFFSCSQDKVKLQKYDIAGNGLGTTYSISYFSTERLDLKPELDSIFAVINSSMSTYHQDSDISRLNRGEDVELDVHFINVFNASIDIYNKTSGYFDPSIGPLVNAYGFGPTTPLNTISSSVIDSIMEKVSLEKFKVTNKKLECEVEGFFLDFNAIAKGYTVDVIAGHLQKNGLKDFFVELGGEIVAVGKNSEKNQSWNFGIEKPIENNETRNLTHAIKLENKALATSGNYRKFRVDEATSQKFVHTINPKTGMAEKSNILSASVVADKCMIADAYATAFMAMGYANALEVITQNNLSALLIYVDENNAIQYFNTQDLNDQITEMD